MYLTSKFSDADVLSSAASLKCHSVAVNPLGHKPRYETVTRSNTRYAAIYVTQLQGFASRSFGSDALNPWLDISVHGSSSAKP